jgi:hypothetical protein
LLPNASAPICAEGSRPIQHIRSSTRSGGIGRAVVGLPYDYHLLIKGSSPRLPMTKRLDPTRSQRGGKREGAGRHPSVPGGKVQITISLPADVLTRWKKRWGKYARQKIEQLVTGAILPKRKSDPVVDAEVVSVTEDPR